MTRFDPDSYPGRRASGPTLVYRGREWPLRPTGDPARPWDVDEIAAGASVLEPSRVRWSVAYGANASPDRLVDKALDERGAVLLPARVADHEVAWEARRTVSTGAVPVTLVHAPRRDLRAWALGIDVADTAVLDASEGRGTNYLLGHVGAVAVHDRWLLTDAVAYGPGPGTRILAAHGAPLTHPQSDQRTAAAALDAEAVTLSADPLRDTVVQGWPETPLADLDLFVYGTLRPGGTRWPEIADLVEVVGSAETRGTLTATFYGWPAADVGGSGRLHGVVLRPRDRQLAARLYARTDRIEDVPRLFERRTVRVDVDRAPRWAAVYSWNASQGRPPGTILPDGVWTE